MKKAQSAARRLGHRLSDDAGTCFDGSRGKMRRVLHSSAKRLSRQPLDF